MVFAPVAPTAFGAGHETSSIGAREALGQLIASDHRSEEHKARDGYRHPYETLTFFGIEPGMTVVEIWPGGQGSWYREIIEPFIAAGGGAYIPVTEDHDFLMSEEGLPYGEADMVLVFRAHGFMISDKPAQRYVDALFACSDREEFSASSIMPVMKRSPRTRKAKTAMSMKATSNCSPKRPALFCWRTQTSTAIRPTPKTIPEASGRCRQP